MAATALAGLARGDALLRGPGNLPLRPSNGSLTDVATGLPSLATEDGQMFAIGPNDLSFHGRGNLFFTIGFGGDPNAREDLFGPDGAKLAHLGRATPNGAWKLVEEFPASSKPMSIRPATRSTRTLYGILALAGKQIVADAGANALVQVRVECEFRPLATFPNRLVEAPPFLGLPPGTQIPDGCGADVGGPLALTATTTSASSPDSHFPSAPRTCTASRRTGPAPEVFASGFTHIVDWPSDPTAACTSWRLRRMDSWRPSTTNDWTGALDPDCAGRHTNRARAGSVDRAGRCCRGRRRSAVRDQQQHL